MDGSGAAHPAPPLRAGDGDRVATVHVLQDAVARGLLTPDEGSDRMAAAFAAVHLHDLAPLTADLPPAPAVAQSGAPSGAPGWRPLGLMAWEQVRTTVSGARGGGPATVRLALAAVLTLLVLVAFGSFVLHALFDGPGDWGRGPGGGGPGRD
jgi:hypothetical protein